MQNKFLLLTVMLFAFSCGSKERQEFEEIEEKWPGGRQVEIKNEQIKNSITSYRDSFDLGGYPVKLELKESGKITRYYLSYIVNKSDLENNTPSLFSKVDGSLVLIYTGLEPFVSFDSQYVSYIREEFSDFLNNDISSYSDKVVPPIIFHPTYWYIELEEEEYKLKAFQVSELPKEDFAGEYVEEDTLLLYE